MSAQKKERALRRGAWLWLLLALLVLVGGISAGVGAKYVSERRTQAEMYSAKFHISSDYLKEVKQGITAPSYTLVGRPASFQIKLYNYELENTAQRAAMEIPYTVTVTNGSAVVASTQGSGSVTNSAGSYSGNNNEIYTLTGQSFNGEDDQIHTLTVTPNAGASSVTVTVTTTSPYVKTLSGVFAPRLSDVPHWTLAPTGTDGGFLALDTTSGDGGVTSLLTIETNGYSGDITITCGLAPDNTNNIMAAKSDSAAWQTGGQYTFNVGPNETYELLFFGTVSGSTSGYGSSITVGG